jgi:phosphatidate cytidylyltransferase
MRRLLTAAIAVPLALLATFRLPGPGFFVFMLAIFVACSVEYVQLLRPLAQQAPLWVVPFAVPPAALGFYWTLSARGTAPGGDAVALVSSLAATVLLGALLLLGRTPPAQAPAALGIIGFGVPFFAMPVAVGVIMQRLDPWLLFLLYAIVWLGDTAAYYVGSAWGRHKMAPLVSPNKSWEGAIAGFLTGIVATVLWSWWRLGEIRLPLLLVAAATGIAAQLGDLFESLLKRDMGIKDTGRVLGGHGGVLDRLDAPLFASVAAFYVILALDKV